MYKLNKRKAKNSVILRAYERNKVNFRYNWLKDNIEVCWRKICNSAELPSVEAY